MNGLVEQFFVNGYATVANAVEEKRCNEALRLVNKRLEKGAEKKELVTEPEFTGLFNETPTVKAAVAALLGIEQNNVPFMFAGQLALRFPGTLCLNEFSFEPVPFWSSLWHIDGLPSKENGIAVGTIKNFTLLVGICLRDVTEEVNWKKRRSFPLVLKQATVAGQPGGVPEKPLCH
jgi:hypothetical protein